MNPTHADMFPTVNLEALACGTPLASEDCRARAVECFDKDRCFERYVDLYNELLC